jgi:hypothetical protein
MNQRKLIAAHEAEAARLGVKININAVTDTGVGSKTAKGYLSTDFVKGKIVHTFQSWHAIEAREKRRSSPRRPLRRSDPLLSSGAEGDVR